MLTGMTSVQTRRIKSLTFKNREGMLAALLRTAKFLSLVENLGIIWHYPLVKFTMKQRTNGSTRRGRLIYSLFLTQI